MQSQHSNQIAKNSIKDIAQNVTKHQHVVHASLFANRRLLFSSKVIKDVVLANDTRFIEACNYRYNRMLVFAGAQCVQFACVYYFVCSAVPLGYCHKSRCPDIHQQCTEHCVCHRRTKYIPTSGVNMSQHEICSNLCKFDQI